MTTRREIVRAGAGLAAIIAAGKAPAALVKSMLGMRGTMTSGGWKNPYITDGLVAMWDGEWNAGPGKHTSNLPIDLIGGIGNFSLSQDTVIMDDDSVVFSGDCGIHTPMYRIGDQVLTMSICAVRHSSSAGGFCALFIDPWFGINLQARRNVRFTIGSAQDINFSTDTAKAATYTLVRDVTQCRFYVDYMLLGQRNSSVTSLDTKELNVGSLFGSISGRVYGIRFYSRVLTESEIAANCAVDKARFNLPNT